jgi:hypothetical protein
LWQKTYEARKEQWKKSALVATNASQLPTSSEPESSQCGGIRGVRIPEPTFTIIGSQHTRC